MKCKLVRCFAKCFESRAAREWASAWSIAAFAITLQLFAIVPSARASNRLQGAPTAASPASLANTNEVVPAIRAEYDAAGLRINFHGAPINLILEYLSDAAGFVINNQTDVRGNIEVWSKQPVTKDEAVELLNSALAKNGYAMTRKGRLLTIMRADNSKTADTEIVVSADPTRVGKSDQVQTQIIPVRYATASQLVANLEQLLPTTASLKANESANTLILVATKTDIKRMLKIIDALDNSMASSASLKVLPLKYANAKDTAAIITQLFAPQTSNQTAQNGFGKIPNSAGPPGAFGPPDMNQDNNNAGNKRQSSPGRGSVAGRVTAVADERSNSVVVSAPADLISSIQEMAQKLDQPMSDITELRVFRLKNAVPSELADQLAQLFPDDSNSNSQGGDVPILFPGAGPGASMSTGNSSSASNDRMKKLGKVLAVPDPRTSSLVVSAARTLMPQIAGMVAEVDTQEGKREIVSYFELRNADPQDISQSLQDLFNRNVRSENNNQNTFLGKNNPLTQRALQNQQSTTSSTLSSGSGSGSGQGGTGGRSAGVP